MTGFDPGLTAFIIKHLRERLFMANTLTALTSGKASPKNRMAARTPTFSPSPALGERTRNAPDSTDTSCIPRPASFLFIFVSEFQLSLESFLPEANHILKPMVRFTGFW
jgi:hypothetical protein